MPTQWNSQDMLTDIPVKVAHTGKSDGEMLLGLSSSHVASV